MNASTGVRTQPASAPRTAGAATGRMGRSDHQSPPPLRGDSGSLGYGAPASTHARTAATSSFERPPLGGISPSETFSTSRLSAGRPGTIADPALAAGQCRRPTAQVEPPFFFSGP